MRLHGVQREKIPSDVRSLKKKVLTVKEYTNTHFVNVMVEKTFYTKLKKTAEKLGTSPEIIINNALLLTLKRIIAVDI
ncbi:MAG: hypothetical protein ACTSUS_08215 [Candidatus Freyarchaeota archaeon]